MNEARKKQVAAYVQYRIRRSHISQKKLADKYGCSQSAISGVVHGTPSHQHLISLREFIAQELGAESWAALCNEAPKEEAIV